MPIYALSFLALVLGQTGFLVPRDHLRSLEIDKQNRTYRVHVPPVVDANKKMPVVLALHGATMTAKSMENFTGLNSKADEAGFIVVYPNGTGPSSFLYTWNSGGFSAYFAQSKPNDVEFIAKVLDDVEANFPVDKKRIYATGMSNGAMMCYRLAAEMSERLAAIAPVSGTMAIDKYEPKRPVPVLHIHGTVDSLVPFEGSSPKISALMQFRSVEDTVAMCVKCNGAATEPKITRLPTPRDQFKITRKEYEARKQLAEVILYVVEGGGHTWPGRPFGGGLLGSYTLNMNANDVIWEFFQRHER